MASDQSQTDEEDLLLFDQLLDVSVCNEDDLLSVCGSSILDSESLLGTHEDLELCTTPTTKPSLPPLTSNPLQQRPLQQPSDVRELVCGSAEDQPCEEGRGDGAGVWRGGEERGSTVIQLNRGMGFRYVPDLPELEMPPLARGRGRGRRKGRGSKRSRPNQTVSEPSLLLNMGSPRKRQKRISDLRMMITANRQARTEFTCTKQLVVSKKQQVRFGPPVVVAEPPPWTADEVSPARHMGIGTDLGSQRTTASPGTSTRPGPGTSTKPGTTTSPGTCTRPETTTSPGTCTRPETTTSPGTCTRPWTTTSPGTCTRPGTTNSPGTSTRPGTTTSPGTCTRPGTTTSPSTPRTCTRPGTTTSPSTPRTCTRPGTTNSPGTCTRPGTTTSPSTPRTSTSPGTVGIRTSPGALGLSFHILPSQSIFVCRPALINKKPGGFSLGHLRQCPASRFSLNHLRS